MKKLVLLFSIALLSFSSFAQSKVGTIDAEYIVSQMPEMTEINEGLKTYNTELQQELETTVSEYETLVTDYQANSATLSEEEKGTSETKIIGLENEIKNFRQRATLMMQMKRNELAEPLYEKVNEAMLQVVTEEGFTQIFHAGGNTLAFSAEGYDITQKVMTKLGMEITE